MFTQLCLRTSRDCEVKVVDEKFCAEMQQERDAHELALTWKIEGDCPRPSMLRTFVLGPEECTGCGLLHKEFAGAPGYERHEVNCNTASCGHHASSDEMGACVMDKNGEAICAHCIKAIVLLEAYGGLPAKAVVEKQAAARRKMIIDIKWSLKESQEMSERTVGAWIRVMVPEAYKARPRKGA